MSRYELTLNKNYVSDWGVVEAIREILQNAIDSEKLGNEKEISYDEKTETLTVKNAGVSIDASTLILGNGTKSDNNELVGGFGEGFKLALLVLLRNNLKVRIENGQQLWTPKFVNSKKYKTELLTIISEKAEFDHLAFVIEGLTKEFMDTDIYPKFPCIDGNYGKTENCSVGQILLDAEFSGMMFVEGLFIQYDDSFSHGYNFSVDAVKLDRDRKAINYYELKRLTAQALLSTNDCTDDIFKSIQKRSEDSDKAIDFIDSANFTFLKSYTEKYFEKHNLPQNTFVGTEEVVKLIKRNYPDIQNTHVGTTISSKLIAKYQNQTDLLNKVITKTTKKATILDVIDDFEESQLRRMLLFIFEQFDEGNITASFKDNFIEKLYEGDFSELNPYNFNKIESYVFDNLPHSLNINNLKVYVLEDE